MRVFVHCVDLYSTCRSSNIKLGLDVPRLSTRLITVALKSCGWNPMHRKALDFLTKEQSLFGKPCIRTCAHQFIISYSQQQDILNGPIPWVVSSFCHRFAIYNHSKTIRLVLVMYKSRMKKSHAVDGLNHVWLVLSRPTYCRVFTRDVKGRKRAHLDGSNRLGTWG